MAETINMVDQQIEHSAAANNQQSYERRCASYIDVGRGADTDSNLVGCSEVARDQATTTHTTNSFLEHSCSYAAGTSGNAGTTRSSGMIGLCGQALWQRARQRQTCDESVCREKIGRQQMLGALSLLSQCKPELVLSLNRVLLCISNIWPRGPLESI